MNKTDRDDCSRLLQELKLDPRIQAALKEEIFRRLGLMQRPTLPADDRGPAGGPLG